MDDAAARSGTGAGGDAALDDVAAELYGLDRDEFTQVRNERARSVGDRDLAARIRKLRKPTVAAARVNRFAREHPDRVRRLRTLGDELRSAHAALDGDRIRELSQRRRALVDEAAEVEASDSGDGVSREVHETFDAAVTDAGAGEAVACGRLVSALQPADVFAAGGFGADVDGAEAAPADARRPGDTDRRAQADRRDREHRGKKQQRRERERRERLRGQARQDSRDDDREKERREQERQERERQERERREEERRERERREERRREHRERRRQRNAELAEAREALGDAVTELREAEAAEAEARRRTSAARKAFDAADRRVHEAEVALADVTDERPDLT